MKLLKVDTIDEAQKKVLGCIKKIPIKTETVSLDKACNRILAEDIFSPCDVPSFRKSTVDGFAVIAENTTGAGELNPVLLKQIGSVSIGKRASLESFSINSGECVYVPTGGMIPDGADAMIMIEYTELIEQDKNPNEHFIAVSETAAFGQGIVGIGEDIRSGELQLKIGRCLRPQEIGVLAAIGITTISVFVPLSISIISTGDEIVLPDTEPSLGEVRDVNTFTIKSSAEKNGFKVVSSQALADNMERLENAAREVMGLSDIVIISGGSSQGEKDFTAKIIENIAKPGVFTHGLALKPGKPTILGWDEESKTLFAGLPGHPVSAIIVFELLLGSLTQKDSWLTNLPIPAQTSANIPGAPGKTTIQPVILTLKNKAYFAEPVFGKSAAISALTKADGYIIIEQNKEGLEKGQQVLVYLF
ncbi:MAG: molybdopterin-binding protein [Treponema sp.]|nr:molybdopterin-binding protein [Treponema sp.]